MLISKRLDKRLAAEREIMHREEDNINLRILADRKPVLPLIQFICQLCRTFVIFAKPLAHTIECY